MAGPVAKRLRRFESWAARTREHLEGPSPQAGEATSEAGYGSWWRPETKAAAMSQIYNTSNPDAFEDGGEIDAKWLASHYDATSTVLDLGCGIGRVARLVAPQCHALWAVDASPRMLQLASANLAELGNVKYALCHDTSFPDVPDQSVDLAYSILVLQHVEREDAFLLLKELRRVVRPTGTVMVTFPNLLSDVYLQGFLDYVRTGEVKNPTRARIYTPQEVERLLPQAGFAAEIDAQIEIRAICRPV
jgi:ubiquinone/menaquinone biosynthesis C-methylase UbiE